MTLSLFRARPTVVWVVLVAATIVSWAVGSDHGPGSAVAVVVLAVAAIKVRFVGLDFMELCNAPLSLDTPIR
jgi:parvulin-like peptidyl-prolyl isomerase